MSDDRRPSNPERLKNESGYIYERSRQDVSPDVLVERLAQFDDLGVDWQARNVPEFIFDLIAVARDPVAVVRRGVESGTIKGAEAWKCETHGGDFQEREPDDYAMCMSMLYEDAWDALPPPEKCKPMRVLVIPVDVGEDR